MKPNILILMADQMQGRLLEPDHPCKTPNLDRLASRGVRFRNGYTTNAVCSPARAGLMTGLLPHNHGVLEVTHCTDGDQSCLREDKPHFAQRLSEAGYLTGYFGKWHVERSNELERFGWQVNGSLGTELATAKQTELLGPNPPEPTITHEHVLENPEGYARGRLYAVTDVPPEKRGMGIATSMALDFLDQALQGQAPWCCFASVTEPHDPFVCGRDAFAQYDVDSVELPPNVHDELYDKPGIYRVASRVWQHMSQRDKQEAAACYWALTTEIDGQFGRLLDRIEAAGQLDNTTVILTADHGELLGAHGLYCKNISGFEEVYNIPMLVAGPGVARGVTTDARVGSHDLCPTLCELGGARAIDVPDSRSFAGLLGDPSAHEDEFDEGFAEYHGTRIKLTQRVYWKGPWKYLFNGFDVDELYNLDDDPYELNNLAEEPAHRDTLREMARGMWRVVRDTDDHNLFKSHYPILRVGSFGPQVLDDVPG